MSSVTIARIVGRQIFDSRGQPTVEAELTTSDGRRFLGVSPSGASTGIFEALELRDGGSAYHGKGVSRAVAHVNDVLAPALVGKSVLAQRAADDEMVRELDGSHGANGWTKAKLGANAILAVSMALCRAGAHAAGLPLYAYIAELAGRPAASATTLPVPFFNVLNGGEHSGAPIAMQEFMIAPVGAASFAEAMRMGSETYHHLKALIKKKFGVGAVGVGDEGGFAPDAIATPEAALDLIVAAIDAAGYTGRVKIALDVAASEFSVDAPGGGPPAYDLGKKQRARGDAAALPVCSGEAMLDLYARLAAAYPIVSIEDPFEQQDATRWQAITARLGADHQIVADDATVTNPPRVRMAIDGKWANALLTKVNQIGSISESIDAVLMAQAAGWGIMVSHRSGETEDCFIADFAVALTCKQIKSGAPCRSERLAKYNQLLRIEEALGPAAVYAGAGFRTPPTA